MDVRRGDRRRSSAARIAARRAGRVSPPANGADQKARRWLARAAGWRAQWQVVDGVERADRDAQIISAGCQPISVLDDRRCRLTAAANSGPDRRPRPSAIVRAARPVGSGQPISRAERKRALNRRQALEAFRRRRGREGTAPAPPARRAVAAQRPRMAGRTDRSDIAGACATARAVRDKGGMMRPAAARRSALRQAARFRAAAALRGLRRRSSTRSTVSAPMLDSRSSCWAPAAARPAACRWRRPTPRSAARCLAAAAADRTGPAPRSLMATSPRALALQAQIWPQGRAGADHGALMAPLARAAAGSKLLVAGAAASPAAVAARVQPVGAVARSSPRALADCRRASTCFSGSSATPPLKGMSRLQRRRTVAGAFAGRRRRRTSRAGRSSWSTTC